MMVKVIGTKGAEVEDEKIKEKEQVRFETQEKPEHEEDILENMLLRRFERRRWCVRGDSGFSKKDP